MEQKLKIEQERVVVLYSSPPSKDHRIECDCDGDLKVGPRGCNVMGGVE